MVGELISVDDARRRARSFMRPVAAIQRVPLDAAAGRILAKPIFARIENPRFDQSAMDGYALRGEDAAQGRTTWQIAGRIAAGGPNVAAGEGMALRIFTGAPLPAGFDTVIMQEHVKRDGDRITLSHPVMTGANIRRRGEDIALDSLLLAQGQFLDARHVALLAGQGLGEVDVFARVRVAVMSTGDELRQIGQELDDSAIYDSNRQAIMALARAAGADVIDGGAVADSPTVIAGRLSELIGSADLIVTTGGASVGEEDHCAEAFQYSGGHLENLKIAMKPGKPAIVGRCGPSAYLGLPGNPIAAIVVWWLLGETMLQAAQGCGSASPPFQLLPSKAEFAHKPGRTEFVPARLAQGPDGIMAEIIGRGGSARLLPLIQADGFVEIPADQGSIQSGDLLRFRSFFGGLTV